MAQPVKGVAYEVPPFELVDIFDPQFFLNNPSIAVGDFKLSKDFGGLVNLTITPVVTPAGSSFVKLNINTAEMTNVSKIGIAGKDQAGKWGDVTIAFDVPVSNTQTAVDILEGDRLETSTNYKIFKKGTPDILVDKDISGSLLNTDVTITTLDP